MEEQPKQSVTHNPMHRRHFVKKSAAAAGFMILNSKLVRGTAANSALQMGMIGCGGRGAAVSGGFLENTNTRIHAIADLFDDQLEKTETRLNKHYSDSGTAKVDPSLIFRGPNAYKQMAASSDVDVVLITSPAYYHPQHLRAVVEAGKHAYCEKPVGVDVAGCKEIVEIGKMAQGRLSLDVGFQIRDASAFVALTERIHAGALGTIGSGQVYYYSGELTRPDRPGISQTESRLRNWMWDRVLSGDIIVEQNIHVIDVCNWVLQSHPLKASGSGGRKVVKNSGNNYDHYNVTYTYPGDVVITFSSSQYNKGWWDVCERFFGSKGVSEAHYDEPVAIYGENPWDFFKSMAEGKKDGGGFSTAGSFGGALGDSDSNKQKAFEESIRSGNYHNQAAQGAESALSAILGREAAYTGEAVNWYELLESDQRMDAGIDLWKL